MKELFSTLNTRPDGVCNFIDASKWFGKGARIVYRQYATLFFIFAIDASESELGILDLIQARAPRLAPHGGTVERWAGRRVGPGEGSGEGRDRVGLGLGLGLGLGPATRASVHGEGEGAEQRVTRPAGDGGGARPQLQERVRARHHLQRRAGAGRKYVISVRAAHRTFVLCFGGPASRVVWSCREVVECDGVRLRYSVTY